MSGSQSVMDLLEQMEHDQSQAARKLWDHFIHRLIAVARRRLQNLPRRAMDEEDVVVSAFDAFFRGIGDGRFRQLDNEEDLWQVLAMLTERKAIAVIRRELAHKRGGGLNRGESVFEKLIAESSVACGLDQVEDTDPAVVDLFTLEIREMLDGLDDQLLRKIAVRRLEGYTNQEIAQQLGIAVRAVERKLQLIRQKWESASPG